MWLSLLIALLTYFLSPNDTAAERRSALLKAGAAGAVTYGVTEYTDWGQANLGPLDDSIGAIFTPPADPNADPSDQKTATVPGIGAGGGVWDSIKNIGAPALAGVAGLAVGSSLSTYLPWILGGLALFLITKD